MFDPWRSFIDATTLGIEAQGVIALRTLRLAAGGPAAFREAERMVAEKVAAFCEAEMVATVALVHGASFSDAAEQAFVPVRVCVEQNLRRLSGG